MTGLINQDDYIKTSIKFFIRKRYNQVDYLIKCGYEIEDIEQELHISIFTARTAYNPEKGAFSTFLKHVLNNSMSKLVEKLKAEKRSADIVFYDSSSEDNILHTSESVTSQTLSQTQTELRIDFNDFYRTCSEKEQYFLNRCDDFSMKQIAKDMKIHRSTLYDLQNKISTKLKNAGFENYFH
jgi:RNA polymerase sigma factor (sigma-70 family)